MKRWQSSLCRVLLLVSALLVIQVSMPMADDDDDGEDSILIVGFRCDVGDTSGRVLEFQGVLDGAGINFQCPIFNVILLSRLDDGVLERVCAPFEDIIRPLLRRARCALSPTTTLEGRPRTFL